MLLPALVHMQPLGLSLVMTLDQQVHVLGVVYGGTIGGIGVIE